MVRIIHLVSPQKNNYSCSIVSHKMQFTSLYSLVTKISQFLFLFQILEKILKQLLLFLSAWFAELSWPMTQSLSNRLPWRFGGKKKITAYNISVYNSHSQEQMRSWNCLIFSRECSLFDPGKWEIKQCQPAVSSILLLHNNSAVGFANGVYELPAWDWPLGKETFAQWASCGGGGPFRWFSAGVSLQAKDFGDKLTVFNSCFKAQAAFTVF